MNTIIPGTKYTLQNGFTKNLIAEGPFWGSNGGLCGYAGVTIPDAKQQEWTFEEVEPNKYRIFNAYYVGFKIAAHANGYVFPYNGPNAQDQVWEMVSYEGGYRIHNDANAKYLYDTSGCGVTGALSISDYNAFHPDRFYWNVVEA